MTISSIPSNTASAITPFNPLGKLTVGEEEKDSKNSTIKAVEESSQSQRGALRQDGDDKHGKVEAREEDSQQRQQQREDKQQERQDREEIRELAARDREVRNHERAHAAVGGQYAGAPSYQFKRGPDGVNYAVAGEVSIDTSSLSNDPQATINKAQLIRRAALAPADPSPQDRRVAAQAMQMEITAREELSDKRRTENEEPESEKTDENSEKKVVTNNKTNDQSREKSATDVNQNEDSQRIVAINNSYLNLDKHLSRLGSIVSEAV